jgi:uncharacterized cupin superfamily protein
VSRPDDGRPAAFAVDVAGAALEPLALDPAQVLDGAPETRVLVLEEADHGAVTVQRGVWEHTPGVSTDVEADELFVVLAGRATVEIAGGETLELAPGVAGVLRNGDRTVWRVRETLRKVYVATLPAGG